MNIWNIPTDLTHRAKSYGSVQLEHDFGTNNVQVGVCVFQPTLPKFMNELWRNIHDRDTSSRNSSGASK